MSQKIYVILGIVLILIGGYLYFGNSITPQNSNIPNETPTSSSTDPNPSPIKNTPSQTNTPQAGVPGTAKPSTSGSRVVFAITDKATQLQGIKSALINIEKLWVRHEKLGWYEVNLSSKAFDLMELKQSGNLKLLSDTKLPVGNYIETQIKIGTLAIVPIVGTPKTAMPLAQDIKFGGRFTVKATDPPLVVWDFLLDKALHTTTNNTYIFAPAIQFRSSNNSAIEISNQIVKAAGSYSNFSLDIGIDENGLTKQDYAMNPNFVITVLSKGVLKFLNPNDTDSNVSVSDSQAIMLAESGGHIAVVKSIKLTKEGENSYWVISGFRAGAFVSIKINAKTGIIVN